MFFSTKVKNENKVFKLNIPNTQHPIPKHHFQIFIFRSASFYMLFFFLNKNASNSLNNDNFVRKYY